MWFYPNKKMIKIGKHGVNQERKERIDSKRMK
jgi:hypothetical protein